MTSIRRSVGANVRAARKEKEWSQEKLAARAKLSSDYVGRLERGEVNIGIDALARIAGCLEVSFEEFFQKVKPVV
jgi:transcriptional regulator with XRE-family HTH domain